MTEQIYTVQEGDSLWSIAENLYGDGNKWSQIYEANREAIGTNPDELYPGTDLAIPPVD